MRSRSLRHFVVVSTPIFRFLPGVVKVQEPVGVETFASELSVEGFDEAIVRRSVGLPGREKSSTTSFC
jgi:hypothetical protein